MCRCYADGALNYCKLLNVLDDVDIDNVMTLTLRRLVSWAFCFCSERMRFYKRLGQGRAWAPWRRRRRLAGLACHSRSPMLPAGQRDSVEVVVVLYVHAI